MGLELERGLEAVFTLTLLKINCPHKRRKGANLEMWREQELLLAHPSCQVCTAQSQKT